MPDPTTKPENAKPSAGAMRAARAIQSADEWDLTVIGHVIDDETGLPDLLEACKAVLQCYTDCGDTADELGEEWNHIKAIRAAIAKAEGKS
jgi:hypothetical protein